MFDDIPEADQIAFARECGGEFYVDCLAKGIGIVRQTLAEQYAEQQRRLNIRQQPTLFEPEPENYYGE